MKRAFVLVVLVLLLFPLRSFAGAFSQMVVFGDSLSDTGNIYTLTGHLYPREPNYSSGLFTDGPYSNPSTNGPVGVWDQQLAGMLGLPAPAPSLEGGTNYAYGGARTGTTILKVIPGVVQQVGLYLSSNTASTSSLYTIWAGANDFLASPRFATARNAVNNLETSINTLYAAGARNFLWLNMPPLGNTPYGLASGHVAYLNLLSGLYNFYWRQAIRSLSSADPGIDIVGVDIYGLNESILSDPSAYGFTDVTDPAQGLNVNPNDYAFWDDLHPTTEGHYWVANLANQDLAANLAGTDLAADKDFVPEPPTGLLLGIVFLAAAFWEGFGTRKSSSA